jgi:long-chain acyl-CoA synthetase
LGLRAAYNRRTEKVGDRKMGSTINERFLDVVGRRGEASAFMVKRDGTWRTYSYDWMLEQAQRSAFGLRSLGFEAGNRIGILAENRPEWATTDFGAMAAGCALVPMYTTLIPDQVAYILNDSEAKAVFVSTMDHLETVLSIRDKLPHLRKVIVFYPENLEEDDFAISLDTLKSHGEGHTFEEFQAMARETGPDDTATLIYTSGTTGDPKGVVLSHRNFIAEFEAVEPFFEGTVEDIVMSFLPLSHILQRVTDMYSLLFGMRVAYAESLETLGENLREVRPTSIAAVPRVYEKIAGRILEGAEKGSALKRRLFNWALDVGRRYRRAEARGSVPSGLAVRHAIADRLVFGKIRAATGGRMRFYAAAGAPLPADLAEFFYAVGIKILEVYGMTELSGAVTVNTSSEFLFGSVGKVCPGVELKITEEGEVCVRGDLVMQEYWNKPEATAETIDADGWLHSGDVGHIDDDGFVYITDRMKELIVTAGGKNVAPQPLENALKADKYVGQAMVIGDRRNFISALIVPEREVLVSWAAEQGLSRDVAELCRDERVIDHFTRIVEERMAAFSRYERVREFRLVPEEFTQEAGELTPTLKLKRRVLLAKYEDLIGGMYAATKPR